MQCGDENILRLIRIKMEYIGSREQIAFYELMEELSYKKNQILFERELRYIREKTISEENQIIGLA